MPTTIVTRAGKGSPLTFTEMDANFVNLKATADAAATLGANIFTGLQTLNLGLIVGAGSATPGTAGAPILTFGTTTDAGFFRDGTIGANAIAWSASGTASGRLLQAELNFVSNGQVSWNDQVNTFAGSTTDTALRRSAAGVLQLTNGSGATLRDLNLRNVIQADANGAYHQRAGMTVANLPAAPVRGMSCYVTDANATFTAGIGAVVAGGGASIVPVFYDGTNWRIG